MNIDPRWISTPVGAAIGVALTRKVLDKKDHTFKNLAIGGGLGGGAGYIAGEFARTDPGQFSLQEGQDPREAMAGYLDKDMRTGYVSPGEIRAIDAVKPILGDMKKGDASPYSFRQGFARENLSLMEQYRGHAWRAKHYRMRAEAEQNPERRKALMAASEKNQEMAKFHGSKLMGRGFRYGVKYPVASSGKFVWSLLKDMMKI